MFGLIQSLFGIGEKVVEKIFPDRARLQERQLEINAETERASGGGFTPRKAFMYVLVLCFVWEVMVRPVVVTYWPQTVLPPSMLKDVMLAMSSLFGLGW